MPLCDHCQAVMNQDPLAALIRRNMDGHSILCQSCRQQIFLENAAVMDGQKSFVFENPAKLQTLTHAQTHTETPKQAQTPESAKYTVWNCKRCSARVWAKPRSFVGNIEPETWWWCRVCIREEINGHERDKLAPHVEGPFKNPKQEKHKNSTKKIHNKKHHNNKQTNTLDRYYNFPKQAESTYSTI
jgi:DNA-directed RNA polymerase subunit RPC12/RpoP